MFSCIDQLFPHLYSIHRSNNQLSFCYVWTRELLLAGPFHRLRQLLLSSDERATGCFASVHSKRLALFILLSLCDVALQEQQLLQHQSVQQHQAREQELQHPWSASHLVSVNRHFIDQFFTETILSSSMSSSMSPSMSSSMSSSVSPSSATPHFDTFCLFAQHLTSTAKDQFKCIASWLIRDVQTRGISPRKLDLLGIT